MRFFLFLLVLSAGVVTTGCATLTPYSEVRAGLPPENLVEIDGRSVYVEDGGAEGSAADEPPVVFVHGFGASSYAWRDVVDLLPERHTVAFDLYGFGWTERPPGLVPYTRQGQVELLRALLDHLGVERADLVGHSYGGSVSVAFAIAHPERLRSLTLVDSAHPEYPRRRRSRLARWRPVVDLYLGWALKPKRVQKALERSLADDSLATPELAEAYLERLAVEGARHAFRGLSAELPEGVSDGPPIDLPQVTVPTLLLWGEEDVLITVEDGRRSAERIPCHRFVPIPNAGHLPMEERPEAVAEALREFLVDPAGACE
ncbi:MAG TPA: alpha/beta hydrolase [Thermoanaerobaculia bacterium]|nr:alpha/beta hydrolase [Thermoanaerobaculia bacterium]